jgi:two-component system response regulator (stage 0 sporulation protein A)
MNKEQLIKQTLLTLGVRATSMGYIYLVDVISIIVDDPHAIRGICRGAYTTIADKYNVKYANVERCIRYAIEESYTTAPLDAIERIFGNSVPTNKDHPAARHYIAAVADLVRSEIAAAGLVAVEARVMAV